MRNKQGAVNMIDDELKKYGAVIEVLLNKPLPENEDKRYFDYRDGLLGFLDEDGEERYYLSADEIAYIVNDKRDKVVLQYKRPYFEPTEELHGEFYIEDLTVSNFPFSVLNQNNEIIAYAEGEVKIRLDLCDGRTVYFTTEGELNDD